MPTADDVATEDREWGKDHILSLYLLGMKVPNIAIATGYSADTVYRVVRAYRRGNATPNL